jgi:hypothetical protein
MLQTCVGRVLRVFVFVTQLCVRVYGCVAARGVLFPGVSPDLPHTLHSMVGRATPLLFQHDAHTPKTHAHTHTRAQEEYQKELFASLARLEGTNPSATEDDP